MLWLARNHFRVEERDRNLVGHTFALDDTVYFLCNTDSVFSLYELHPTSLVVSKIVVHFENFEPELCVGGVVSDEKRVLMWGTRGLANIYEGKKTGNEFSITKHETRGQLPSQVMGFAHCLYNGKLIVHGGMKRAPFFSRFPDTFELDLTTMEWKHMETVASEEIRQDLARMCMFYEGNLVIGDQMHAVGFHNESLHFVLDLTTRTWSRLLARGTRLFPSPKGMGSSTHDRSLKFVYEGALYMQTRHEEDCSSMLYRLDENNPEWFPMTSCIFPPTPVERVTIAGSRVLFTGRTKIGTDRATTVTVLEMNPTLFQRASVVLQRSVNGRSQLDNMLPPSIRQEIVQNDAEFL